MKVFSEEQPVPSQDPPSFMDQVLSSADRNYHVVVEGTLGLMQDVADVDRHGFYRAQGFDSTEEWFATHFAGGYRRACEFVEVAPAVDRLSKLKGAYREGLLSYDHLRALVKIIDEDNESELIEVARGLSVAETFRMVQELTKLDSVDSLIARSERWFQKSWDKERRTLMFSGELPEEMGSSFERAIDARAKTIPDDGYPEGNTPMGTKMADALVELVASSSAGRPSKPLVVVHVDHQTLLHKKEGVAYLEGGPTVSPETARRIACDSLVRIITKGLDGKPVALGSATRSVPGRLGTQVTYRDDNTCVINGCRKRTVVEFHHVEHVERDGETEYENIVLLCPIHHHMAHEGGWTLRGSPPKFWLEHPDHPPIKVGPPKRTEEIQAELDPEFGETHGPPEGPG